MDGSAFNLYQVDEHDPTECQAGAQRLRDQRDDARRQCESARMWAMQLEADNHQLVAEVNRLTARLVLLESPPLGISPIEWALQEMRRDRIDGQEEIGGVGV